VNVSTGTLATLDFPESDSNQSGRTYQLADHAVEVQDDEITIVNLNDGVSTSLSSLLEVDQLTVLGSELLYDDQVLVVQAEPSDLVVPFDDPTNAWVVGGKIRAIRGDRVIAELNDAAFYELALVERGTVVARTMLDGVPRAVGLDAQGRAQALTAYATIIEWDFTNDRPVKLGATWEQDPGDAYFVSEKRILTDTNGVFRLVDVDGTVIADLTGFKFRGASGGCLELSGHVYDVESGREVGEAKELQPLGPCVYRSISPESTSRNVAILGGQAFDVGLGVVLDAANDGSAFIARDEQLAVTMTSVDGTVQQLGEGYGTYLFVG
jgi:hypothetical protein